VNCLYLDSLPSVIDFFAKKLKARFLGLKLQKRNEKTRILQSQTNYGLLSDKLVSNGYS
jgi:hypothetical protein